EAVQAYPELYFSRFVILCEGDSEEVIFPRLGVATGLDIDDGFISVVPLGGRHVNHFWRLLSDLQIRHVTLLDLDRERAGGCWGRIKYALTQLLKIGTQREVLLQFSKDGRSLVLSEDQLNTMHRRDPNLNRLRFWLSRLAEHGVFFSAPLDVD